MTSTEDRDNRWMSLALEEAEAAASEGEVPVGGVAVLDDMLLVRDHNRTIQYQDPTAHAEILLLREAARQLGNYRLPAVEIFVTLEPCAMCAGALVWARVSALVFGAWDEKAGAAGSKVDVLRPGLLNHCPAVRGGVRAEDCGRILRRFFEQRRAGDPYP